VGKSFRYGDIFAQHGHAGNAAGRRQQVEISYLSAGLIF
jgi:hypothetical protein